MSSEESSLPVSEWLTVLRLNQYISSFERFGYELVSDCQGVTNEELHHAGVVLPGHQKRILASLDKIFSEEPQNQKPIPKKRNIFLSPPPRNDSQDALPMDGDMMEAGSPKTNDSVVHDKAPPPIPPRVTPNRPPVKFTPAVAPGHLRCPNTLPLEATTSEQQLLKKCTPSPVSEEFHLYEQCSADQTSKDVPPLPAKRYVVGAKETRAPPPLPKRPPVAPPRTVPSSNSPSLSNLSPVNDPEEGEKVPVVPPRTKLSYQPFSLPDLPQRKSPKLSKIKFSSTDSSEGYEYCDQIDDNLFDPVEMSEKEDFLTVEKGKRLNSLYSDDEHLDEDNDSYEAISNNMLQQRVSTHSVVSLSIGVKGDVSTVPQLSPVIKHGWLCKNPPQGSYIYQKRWVKLDAEYLRYFDSDKDMYSKRIIPTASITSVANVGDQKFEVVTNNRTFVFKAESDSDRNEWVKVLQETVRDHNVTNRVSMLQQSSAASEEKQGALELRGLRSKLYVVVSGDKVFLYKNNEDYQLGIGITSIEMNLGNVKDADRRAFDLTTPYRTFSFVADSDKQKEEWMEAMQNSIGEALSNYEVAEKIWKEESNCFCADCGAAQPEWAAINLCVVFCKRCAGEHRGLGPSISKVRSLKMDKKVWTEELVELFQVLGNRRSNAFWAANVPPSEALSPASTSEERRRFISAKYREGKYRRYHPLFGNQEALDKALCINMQSSDVGETLSLVFCGANVNCDTGDPDCPSPISLAKSFDQKLQVEFLAQNKNTEIPRSEVGGHLDRQYYVAPPSITHNGFLFKTGSMGKPVTERKAKEEFSQRWCTLNDGVFSYFESPRNSTPNGDLRMKEIACLAVGVPETHGYDHTFEIYTDSERLYLFGTDKSDAMREWVKSIAKSFIPSSAEDLLNRDFERIGRLQYKDGLNLQSPKVGWFALVGSTLHVCFEDSEEEEAIHLKKLQELSIQQENEVLVLVERRRTLYIQGERKLDFQGWSSSIQRAAGSSGHTLCEQQLTEADIPVIVDRSIDYITQCGLTSEGIYRKSGVNSKIAALLESFRRDARNVRLKEGDHQVDDVSNVLKRFFRDTEEGMFTSQAANDWLSTPAMADDCQRVLHYQALLNNLPRVNKATLRALVNHLYCVQCFSDINQMNLHNLAIVFGPTLFQTDGKDYNAGRVVEDLISHYVAIFNVNEQQLKKQLDEISAIIKLRDLNSSSKVPPAGDFICTVYLEEKKETAEQHIKIPATMTAAELAFEILDRRKITVREKDYWCCFEVNEKEETERSLHYQEKVLPILHSLGTESYLVVKKHFSMEAMLIYLASKVDDSKHGMIKFREDRHLLGLGLSAFHDRYFILNRTSLRLYKEVRSLQKLQRAEQQCSHRPEKEWPVKSLKIYQGIKKKLRPPTCWGLTVVYANEKHEKQQWYLCCDTQTEMREWLSTFLSIQHDGNVWPSDSMKVCASRVPLDARLGNISLIPLRGSENEMRNSVAAFAADPLALFGKV
ncbi:arf-GAP with Rho-GAP domain, ANK repeat and PH domain-containing protein 1-like isoform X1 [Acipenser ruthenus]|uniref:arf-GAP with Rho-GAP domain, ANK repeat and PH domain-containing protein 1-like isoform X1 n=2 Tax=Acipenser ruthenus TaxID=7906 RepID=UPI0027420396|nr:arf-GAP with Rho-GAP domain, ANK repeat and PH domain-containing protein 1-like isoform X1 [Acipenser ruthenus]XP_058887004.1 arf-GAP with Rho-GAP domain, ANK repeat and PH domain-containing protein 1-like isoform X1 [Acipenser ruthenus]XP_058887005.1 arf-GAP with Rho-GAP domain, ANK repeat and PH domain-containing protein 1-like isoform X1 [Acipenser ruthenus]XP_058887007.1 arf-GAP with Rho-GAP domain, ANK repeat and PH domain-containing protein 1-like isoform X1 [Acipenser ruthenus]XP_0588